MYRAHKVRWIVQENLLNEQDINKIKQSCDLNHVEYFGVNVIPFSPILPMFPLDEKTNVYYGSTVFIDNVYRNLDKPIGVFLNDNFSIENYFNQWGEHMLNFGAEITTLEEFAKKQYNPNDLFFIRPDADDKSFAGQVVTFKDIGKWKQGYVVSNIDFNIKIIVSKPYNIKKEWRNTVVDGKIITSSKYMENFKLNKCSKDIPEEMLSFVRSRIAEYEPHKIFTIDVALCGNEYFIIECGCANSCGFYLADIHAFTTKITKYISNAEI